MWGDRHQFQSLKLLYLGFYGKFSLKRKSIITPTLHQWNGIDEKSGGKQNISTNLMFQPTNIKLIARVAYISQYAKCKSLSKFP